MISTKSNTPRLLRVPLLLLVALLCRPVLFPGAGAIGAQTARSWYVAPNASATGDGSIGNPWDIRTAFYPAPAIHPGDTIWLRGGIYGSSSTYSIDSRIRGTAGRPVYIRQYPGERATINGGLGIFGDYAWYWGFEVAKLNWPWPRDTNQSGSFPTGKPADGIYYSQASVGNKIINMIVHDSADGVADQQESSASEVYGTLSYNNGWNAPDRGHGHGLYMQNGSTIPKVVADNITYNSFDIGIQAYGSAGPVKFLHFDGNVVFNSGLPAGGRVDNVIITGGGVKQDIQIDNMVSYRPLDGQSGSANEMDASWANGMNLDLTIKNSLWLGPSGFEVLLLRNWASLAFQGNTLVGPLNVQNVTSFGVWSNNKYYFSAPPSGIDSGSPVFNSYPTGVTTIVRPNKYEPGRANIIVINYDRNPTVTVDLSNSGLTVGTPFQVRDVQSYWGPPVYSGTYNGQPITLPMILTQVTPVIDSNSTPPHTSAEFNAFILLPQGSAPPPAPPPSLPTQAGIALDDYNLSFDGTAGGSPLPSQSVTLTNNGPAASVLTWKASPGSSWLSVTPAGGQLSGGTSTTLNISVSKTGLIANTYFGVVSLTAPEAYNNPQLVNVALTLAAPPNPPPSGQALITNNTLSTRRNNFTGWVGCRLAVGPTPMIVSSLGRLMASGNTQLHTVKLVNAATGEDVSGGSVSVATAQGIPGTFVYVSLASPVTLAPYGTYYLVSRETLGGDSWYDADTSVQTLSDAALTQAVYFDTAWHLLSAANQTYGPLNLGYTLGAIVPPTQPTGQSFVTAKALGTKRSDFTGWVGMQIRIAASPVTVSALGRLVAPGGGSAHSVKLVNAATGQDVPGGSALVMTAGSVAGSFAYGALASPIALDAGATYNLVSQETAGGDPWYDSNTTVQTANVATVLSGVFSNGPAYLPSSSAAHTFGPVDFLYATGAVPPPPPPVLVSGYFVTSATLGALRNDFTGWLGMRILVGSTPLLVSAFGRAAVIGDTASHAVKLVDADTGTDVPGGAATVALGSAAAGAFVYANLASPVTLLANHAYYLVSQETSGGDPWGDTDTTLLTTTDAAVTQPASFDTAWHIQGSSNRGYGPLDFRYSLVPASVPPSPPPGPSVNLVTSVSLGTRRNDFTGWVGMRLVVGSAPMKVSALGRISVAGDVGTHAVKLVDAANGIDVPGGAATVSPGNAAPGTFAYGSLASPVTLLANHAYYLASQEAKGGDPWVDSDTGVQTTSDASVTQTAYFDTAWRTQGSANRSYGPVDLKYSLETVTTLPPPTGPMNLVTSASLGTRRNDFTGWVGMRLLVGSRPMIVSALGRIAVAGGTGSHAVKLVDATTGVDVPGGAITVSVGNAVMGAFVYANLVNPVTLLANHAYYLASQEAKAGDPWVDQDSIVLTSTDASVTHAAYFDTIWHFVGSANRSYGLVDLKYSLAGL